MIETANVEPTETAPVGCRSCGSDKVFAPTFCNFGHCAECFEPLSEEHKECGWDGSEHESYFPMAHGNVWNAGCDDCREENAYGDDPTGPCRVCSGAASVPYIVAVYDVNKCYGGPEEGGWWYDAGSKVRDIRTFTGDEDDAYAFANRLNDKLGRGVNQNGTGLNARLGKYSPGSVACDGFLEARVYEGAAPEGFPDRRPHYE